MANDDLSFTLAWVDIDPAILPSDSQSPGTDVFRSAVTAFLQRQYEGLGGKARIIFNDTDGTLTVHWSKTSGFQHVEQKALEALNQRDFGTAIPLLKALIAKNPKDVTHLYNIGMVYSDQGKLEQAEDTLRQAVALDPRHAHAVVALGVVQSRAGDLDSAVQTLRRAVELDPENTFAHQNLGACLLKRGESKEAEAHFRTSLCSDPNNLQARLGLAEALATEDRFDEADEVYLEIIKTAGHSPAGSLAKEGRTRIAHANLRKGGKERPDVVMYCLGALERFETMTSKEIEALGQEIAILGMKGLDINDPEQKYALRSLPGKFSGLHLVSIMYTAFQKVSPSTDVGIDLSKEYVNAVSLFDTR